MSDTPMQEFWVARDADRLGEHLGRGISNVFFKVSTEDSHGGLLVVEMTHHAKGGPGRHFHYEQDEWFYVVEGEYVFEVGQERIRLKPGDSVFGPRKVPHVWAFVGDATWKDFICLYASRSDGGVFPRTGQGGCDTSAGSGLLSCLRNGVGWAAVSHRMKG